MEQELKRAAQIGDIDAFYGVFEREPNILKMIEEKHFAETPLHVAAQHGQTELSIEILSLMPSFGKKLNPSGYSPLYMALRNGQIDTVKQLIKFDPDLIMVRSRERKTSLHYVAETNGADLVAEFLVACPTAIKKLTMRGETAVHLAVLRGCTRAFEVLMGWVSRTDNEEILEWKDNKGNTALHIAAHSSQLEVIKRLVKERVDLSVKNQENQTALDIVLSRISSRESVENPRNHDNVADLLIVADKIPNQEDVEIQKMLQRAGARESSELPILMSMVDILTSSKYGGNRRLAGARVDWNKGITDETRNMFLVVTVLIITATFQAFLSPPGGGWLSQENSNNNPTLPAPPPSTTLNQAFNFTINKDMLFYPFVIVNSLTFIISVELTFKLISARSSFSTLLGFSLVFLMLAYLLCGLAMTPPDKMDITMPILTASFGIFYSFILRSIFRMDQLMKRFPWLATNKRIIQASGYEMERKVRLGKYVAEASCV